MNISKVSFCGNSNYSQYDNYGRNTERVRTDLRKSTGFDEYVSSSDKTSKKPSHSKKKSHNPYKTLCLLYVFMKIGTMFTGGLLDPQDETTINAKAGEDINDYALVYDMPVEAIMDYNNLSSPILGTNMTISMPSSFDHVGSEIDELQEDLYRRTTSAEEAIEIAQEIEELQDVQKLQSEIAKMYTDGDFVYFYITLPTDETASETQLQYNGHINVESFKDIFGIKDGVIRKHNDMDYSWGSNEYGGYKDYTGNTLWNGQTIKVPTSAVKLSLIESLND